MIVNRRRQDLFLPAAICVASAISLSGCATPDASDTGSTDASAASPEAANADPDMTEDRTAPPPAIRAWMERLTVDHAYDSETGFIVAKEVVAPPPIIAEAPPLDEAVHEAATDGRTVIAFATADRCAPCQQYKKDALNDPRVIARLADDALLATHVEVDRQGELADAYLRSRGIPMTYALRDGEVISTLRGQRSADDLLEWIESLNEA